MIKSASFGVLHLGIAFGVAYALTGNVAIAGAITFVEPLVNTVAHYFFDRGWAHPRAVAWRRRHGLERVAGPVVEGPVGVRAGTAPRAAGAPVPAHPFASPGAPVAPTIAA